MHSDAAGEMAEVYLAEDERLGRNNDALKSISGDEVPSPDKETPAA